MAELATKSPYKEGHAAYRKGKSIASCPYDANSVMGRSWHQGWNDAKAIDIDQEIESNL
jgi:ribosome modulation factor